MKSLTETVFNFILGALVIIVIDYMFKSVYVESFFVAILVAVVLTILNKIVKPILTFLAFPVTILSLGLFQLVINGFILKLATIILAPDFRIDSFTMMIVTSICISILYRVVGIQND